VSGRLWDDTPVYGTGAPSDSYNVGEHTLGGRIVNLRDVSSTLIIASATTLADGTYYFGGVPVGNYTVEVATPSFDDAAPGGSGRIKIRYDAAGGTPVQQSDGVISVSVAEGATIANRDFGYVQLNDAPTIAKPADKIINEDQVLSFDGGVGANSAGVITVADEVQNVSGSNVAALSVNNGVLNLATGFVVPAGVTVAGQGTGAMTLTGSIVNINAVLAKLQYTPNLNYNGSDALTIRIDDKGAQGDADGDCIPNEVIDDNLFTTSVVNITMLAVNDPPIARPDEQTVVGLAPPATGNAITGVGNQIPSPTYGADTDVDGPTLTVVNVSNVKSGSTPVTAGTPGTLIGDYGTLVLQSNGSYTYTQNVAVVSTLNLATGPVSDTFTYSVSDGLAPPVTTTIKINIGPVNAVPVANPDVNSTVEGATAPVGGNVITKPPGVNGDVSDTDATIGGPALVLQGASVGNVAAGPNLTGGLGGTGLTGAHGTLIINSNGSYSYQVNNADPAVIALNPASPAIQDVFTYTVTDTQGGRANTTLTINITGINNPPVANNDTRSIPADQTIANGQAIAGNGLGDVKDTDPDAADAGLLTICGVTPGSTAIVPSTGVGSVITGTFGDLVLQSNGSYTYTPNAAARALPLGQAAVDTFTYCLQDPALAKTTGKITINLLGVNDLPVANPELFQLNKASPPKTGNAITGLLPGEQKDTDPDNDTLTVQGVNSGTPTGPITGRVNTPVVGSYGTLVLQADGSYTYTLDPTKTATIAKTDTVSDVFTYTITDPNGGKSTTTITFKVSGDNQAPSGTDKVLPVNEDTPYLITPADFGFSDPDVGDTFKAVRITTLPDVAAGKLFYNGQEVALTNGFFQVAFADINKLEFRPAPNVNTANLAQAPNISFQVCDNDGLLDPTPNRLTFNIVPVNDPPKATQSVYAMDAGSPTCALDPLPLVSGVRPGATDPDLPADTLTVTLNAVPPADQGQYFVGSSLVPLKAGDTLTPAQLQQLCFKPNTAITGTRLPDGSIATAPLLFTVSDGKGGQDTTGSVQVNVKPTPSLPPVAPPRITPLLPVAPILTVPFLPPPTRAAVTNASNLRAMDDIRLSPIEAASDLDAGGYFDSGRINAVWNRERVAGVQVVAEEKEAPKPKKVEVECEPAKPKEKPKLKVVKRSVFADNLKDGPNKNFTEQLKAAQKRFKPPAKVMPKPQLQRDC
jgi:VCBS repeat-containing protein